MLENTYYHILLIYLNYLLNNQPKNEKKPSFSIFMGYGLG